ncbi:MAG: agmatine deiminase family protein [Sphingomonadaceae bacterium]
MTPPAQPPLPPPAEWAPHAGLWTAWPSHAELWEEDLAPARAAVGAMVAALAQGEPVTVLAATPEALADARAALAGVPGATVIAQAFGDIWLRDTGAIIRGDGVACGFRFNGWGGKYCLPGDAAVAEAMAEALGLPFLAHDWVLEGGAIDGDGTGLAVTTEECLLNPNRNPAMGRAEVEARLGADLGLTRILWLGQGLRGDHTDGHVDNLARFVAPGVLALPVPDGPDDPNAAAFADARARARAAGLEIADMPSPGLVEMDGEPVAASYMNFIIGNAAVVVPQYGRPNDAAAIRALEALFPGRRVVGVDSRAVLTGGGSFHCITQQVPRP